ncbi:hypothetical protein CHT92_11160 [Cutibacterium acnes]|nr:hypothetical protein CP884_11755 [Cutibacterium acnes]RFT43479.1 hypothetical protein CHT92_11160 [Cutibacterium acnes]TLG43108.1 hypothetical protein FD540_11160 [Cutibacterium acnes]TMT72729.1 hypothetical protein DMX87_11175 [Cutibacterium acnes]
MHGRDALMMTADFPIGNHKVLYTTSQPFGAPVVTSGRGTVEYLIGHRGDPGETVLQFKAGSSAPRFGAPEYGPSGTRPPVNSASITPTPALRPISASVRATTP